MNPPRHRLAVDAPLAAGAEPVLAGNPAHYVAHVLRLKPGEAVALFNRTQGEWRAVITAIKKREVMLTVAECLRPPSARPAFHFTACFAPIKGGRLETIIEKATELGAAVLQPVLTRRTIVDKVNLERANAIAREAAEQCERMDWPEIREPVKLEQWLATWPAGVPLVYGDETGGGGSVTELLYEGGLAPYTRVAPQNYTSPLRGEVDARASGGGSLSPSQMTPTRLSGDLPPQGGGKVRSSAWGILVGPEGGFAPEELALLARMPHAIGVGLGPRILRADTAFITLAAATLMAWGDWNQPPRFHPRATE